MYVRGQSILLKLFLTGRLHNLRFCGVCVCCKASVPAADETCVCLSKTWCLALESSQVVPAAGGTGVSVSPTGATGVFTLQPRGRNSVGPKASGWRMQGSVSLKGSVLASRGRWLAGQVSLLSLNQAGVGICVCQLSIKWSSGLDTVKTQGSRVC